MANYDFYYKDHNIATIFDLYMYFKYYLRYCLAIFLLYMYHNGIHLRISYSKLQRKIYLQTKYYKFV